MNAIDFLVKDHEKFKTLFGKVRESNNEAEKRKLFRQIKTELDAHTKIEEEIFYPSVKEKAEVVDIVEEGIQEHHQTDLFIREIENLVDGSDVFDPKLKVLMEGVEHHIQEEEKEMFPKVRDKFTEAELNDLGSKLQSKKAAGRGA